jgi:hypothetical protein
MVEILNIFLQLVIFLIIFSFPINGINIRFFFNENYTLYELIFINFIFFSTICLIFSFANLNFKLLFYFFIIFGLLNLLYNFLYLKKNYLNFIFLLFFTLNFLIFVDIASLPILNWDGLATWSLKMNNFYFGEDYQNLENITYSHQPHLGAYLWALFSKNSFLKYEYLGRLFYIFIFVVSIFSLKTNIKNNKNYYVVILLMLTILLLTYKPYLFGGYQEYLIFSTILFTGNFFYKISNLNKINSYHLFLFSLLLNIILWSKQESLAYIFILQIIFISFKQLSNLQRFVSIFMFLTLLLIKFNFSFLGFHEDPHFNFVDILNFDFKLLIYKLLFITKHIMIAFIKYPIWLIIITIYFVLIFKYNFKDKFINRITLFGFLNFGLIYFVFLTTVSDFEWLVKVTLDRMIFQTTGFYVLLITIYINKVLLKKTN